MLHVLTHPFPTRRSFDLLLDTDDQSFVPGRRLVAVGPEQAIPPGQIEAEVAVRLPRRDRMMDAVHVWRDDEPPQDALEPRRQADVAVVEHRGDRKSTRLNSSH